MRTLLRLVREYLSYGGLRFPGSGDYWERRYRHGGNSGGGSYGREAAFKAKVLNDLVTEHDIESIIEFGCGDGNQLALARYPRYIGVDVSARAVELCRERFAGDKDKSFMLPQAYRGEQADAALSLDVIYHLVEDEVYTSYMQMLFAAARRLVVIYSSNVQQAVWKTRPHIRRRKFTAWVDANLPQWTLLRSIPKPHPPRWWEGNVHADFYVYVHRRETEGGERVERG